VDSPDYEDGFHLHETSESQRPSCSCLTGYSSAVQREELVQWCLVNGANPNAPSAKTHHTILHSAAQHASVTTFALLLAAGADISPTSPSADLVANAASVHSPTNNRIPMISFLLDHGAHIDLMTGTGKNEEEHCCHLFAWGRKNALHWAVEKGAKDLVELLLKKGADTTIKMLSMKTQMKWTHIEELAEICGHEDIVEVLKSHSIKQVKEAKL
jgi:hypothetical protein